MSIVRVGLSSTKKFAEGWEAIFGKKKAAASKPTEAGASRKKAGKPKKKTARKK